MGKKHYFLFDASVRNRKPHIMRIFILTFLIFLVSSGAAYALCSAAPTNNTGDTAIQFRNIGSDASIGAVSEIASTEEGVVVYDDTNNTLAVCDGTNWVTIKTSSFYWDGPSGCSTIGDLCSDGTIYAGVSPDGSKDMYTTPADSSSATGWTSNSSNHIDASTAEDTATGAANTAYLAPLDSNGGASVGTHDAAIMCDDMDAFGHSDWYLPAEDELVVLKDNRVAIGGFGGSNDNYWSSTQTTGNSGRAQRIEVGAGANPTWHNKEELNFVRCVRKEP